MESAAVIPVSLAGIRKTYDGTTWVLDGIDLQIDAGELFFLLGGSGCGKTTLLRLVAGFLQAEAGSIRFGDREMKGLPPERRDIGMVFQNYALWPHLDVAGNVAFGLEVRKIAGAERAKRVQEALDLVGLGGYAARRIGELSGGQQQRVALARALVLRPAVLLLDEPLSNLDARLRIGMRQEIRKLCKQAGVTGIYVTHDQAEALATADRIALLDQGRVAQVGTPRELYERPRSRGVATFLGEANLVDAAIANRLCGGSLSGGTYCLRPERLRCAEGGVAARLVEGSFQGDRAQWWVEIDGKRLHWVELAPPERKAGDIVHLRAETADLVALEA